MNKTSREDELVILGKKPSCAGGLPAVISATTHLMREPGFWRGAKAILATNQKAGIDCPGCAWPEAEDHRSTNEYCENGAKAIAEEATQHCIGEAFFQKYSIDILNQWSDFELGKAGRISEPLFLSPGERNYKKISWQNAFSLIAENLKNCRSPDEAVFYTSGRTSNEAAFLYQLMVRMFGTNNLPDCSNMCHESSGVGLTETIGIGKGTVKLADFIQTELILIFGQNPGTNHPRMLTTLQQAKRKGTKIIVINPLLELGNESFAHPQEPSSWFGRGESLCDLHIPIRINGDVAFLKGIFKLLFDAEACGKKVIDWEFIEQKTQNYESFYNDIQASSWEDIFLASGLGEEIFAKAAQYIINAPSMISCWAMGLTQHVNGVANVQSVVNLHLLKGALGRPGSGLCPVRGHSNVQGNRTMGINDRPNKEFLDRLSEVFNFKAPRQNGYSVVEAILAMLASKVKVFFALGGNFLSASPDTDQTAKALANCELTVQVSTKLNRSHLLTGRSALILPCLARTDRDIASGVEQFVTVENSMGIIHSSQGKLTPVSSELKSEVSIVCELAHQLLDNEKIKWLSLSENYNQIRDLIALIIPGFEDFNNRVVGKRSFYLPNHVRDHLTFGKEFKKAQFSVHEIEYLQLKENEFLMMTIRSHDQYNTTIYGLSDRYRAIKKGRKVVFMNPDDIHSNGLNHMQVVDLISSYNDKVRMVKKFCIVSYPIPRKCIATYFPEANNLIPLHLHAKKSLTPASKSVIVRVVAHDET